ncbi:hypothetical protein MWU57_00930 [Isoptericola sp. S6320L]|uniref:hypothetical protein n=1 Tax=Isoptericola sp. S6320L TaxID=2926411 RepID=UPI001FF155F0|nr:hypothetical protein [Isoptericola sp. S6320L]MCK0115587.1 hypothetical protein [Isoptericola sp. S6320L]
MTADTEESTNAASPYATGGGGTRLEHRLGAVFLARLLTGGPVAELGARPPTKVAFQQSSASRIDDLIVTALSADGVSSLRLDIAVRRTPSFVRSHGPTKKLVAALVAEDIAAESDGDVLVERRLAVAVSGPQTHAQQVAELAAVARAQATAEDFFTLVGTPGRFASRSRLEHLRDMVKDALPEGPESAKHRCWSLLRRLWMMQTQLETGHELTWTDIVDDLKPFAVGASVDGALALRDRLEQLAGEFATNAGDVDANTLRQRLHGQIAPGTHLPPDGWALLMDIDRHTRSTVARSVSGRESASMSLPRADIREQVEAAVAEAGSLVVTGESGVGKSALIMDAIEPEKLGDSGQALALNLRNLPTSHVDLLDLLKSPVEKLLTELTAPKRVLVIDGAEAAAESHRDVFVHLVGTARAANIKVVVITTTEGSATVTELMKRCGEMPRELTIPGLDDEELREAAQSFPALQRLVDDPRARELLRRPIVVDLLARSGETGLPLNEAQALEQIWHHLVRNQNRRDDGEPSAREEVMLALADHEVSSGDVDLLLSRLDPAAVHGLRRSGILLPASPLPWQRVPAFQHDLVRAYAVARLLLAGRDPAAALTTRSTPRWTLPAARIACEILLAAPDDPTYPRSGRLAALQQAFDVLAASGAGQRWSDVPVEAALALPDARDVLNDAWAFLASGDGLGVARLLRVLRSRYQRGGILDPTPAEPVVSNLLEPALPRRVAEDADSLTRDWLRALVLRRTEAGQTTRIQVRDKILRHCADRERVLDEEEAARQAERAARNPEQIAADEERDGRFAGLQVLPGRRRRRRRWSDARRRPYLWIEDSQIEQLALLGPDLGGDGEAILRRIAEDDPYKVVHAVEPVMAGQSLAAHDPKLLLDLAEAYYIEQEDDDDDGWGSSGGLLDDGIRDHRREGGVPLASYLHGPFLAMFRADYVGGVAFLNRMLDHAARFRVRRSAARRFEMGADDETEVSETLSITGESRKYAGDGHVWLWYRGTGVGPYPCMSALQALEFVTEEYIKAGLPPAELTGVMMADANSLAMPALALAVLVRHLEDVGDALDPYLVEPAVWELEFSRAINDQASGLAARVPELAHPERRGWSLREVGMSLALGAEGDRIGHLKGVGDRLLENASRELGDGPSPSAREHLAAVRNWAAGLNRDAYEFRKEGEHVVIEQAPDPDAELLLADTNAQLRRTNDAAGLVVRHAHVRNTGGRAPDVDPDTLAADLVLARALIDDPPQSFGFSTDGPFAVAATALEHHLTSRAAVSLDDLVWSATSLLQVASTLVDRAPDASEDNIFSQGAGRSAGRALPFLLTPAARELRTALSVDGPGDVDELVAVSRGVAVRGDHETRLAFAQSLDAIWAAPCDTDHLHGRCHHLVVFDLVTESLSEVVIGPWDQELQRRAFARLDPLSPETLDAISDDDIYVRGLNPALRAAGSAATSPACCREDARLALRACLSAHQRGMLASEHGGLHSESDSLVAARAALWQALAGDDETILDYIRGYLSNSRLVAEGLQSVAAAAEERPDAGRHARRLWPQIMDLVLDAVAARPQLFTEHTWGAYAQAHLVPNPTAGWSYLTREIAGDPYNWRDLLAWRTQVERWLRTASPQRMSLDHLVIAVRDLDVGGQVEHGLPWIEEAVGSAGPDCAWTYTLPEWLHERRPDITADEDVACWQRVVDFLVVAGDTRVADLAD